jgi:hypothetical protein
MCTNQMYGCGPLQGSTAVRSVAAAICMLGACMVSSYQHNLLRIVCR